MRVKKRERVLKRALPLVYMQWDGAIVVPTKVEKKLREEAEKKFPGDKERQNAYIFGTLRKLGWKPGEKK